MISIVLATVLLAACADPVVRLRYEPDEQIERVPGAQAVTVFRFADARGDEGDGDPLRVGGIYGGYGNRLAKVKAQTTWPDALVAALAAGFTRRGVHAVPVPDTVYAPRSTLISTPFVLGGEIRNFSTEQRWTQQAHVSGIVRLYDQQGALLVEKPMSARAGWPSGDLEAKLNTAMAEFVRKVVTDPDITQRLTAAR